jgi:hypothetical protein
VKDEKMSSVEDAYQVIGTALLECAQADWSVIFLHTKILRKNCSAMSTEIVFENDTRRNVELSFTSVFKVNDASIFLRDDLLRTTGQRIWGLTFTLYPDGKFNIEYDYNKPEGYEETDEIITGDEINASLNRLTGQDKKPD